MKKKSQNDYSVNDFFFHNKNQDIKVTEFLFNKATMSENVNSSK